MPSVGFKPTIPSSEREKTVHALDRSSTVTGIDTNKFCKFISNKFHNDSIYETVRKGMRYYVV
jgi:hypothetical protein